MNRTSVIDAKRELIKAGFKVVGEDDSWHIGLSNLSDAQIRSSVNRIIESHRFNTVKASSVFNASSKGRGGEINPTAHTTHLGGLVDDSWEQWKDNHGREYAYHPSLGNRANNRDQRQQELPDRAQSRPVVVWHTKG